MRMLNAIGVKLESNSLLVLKETTLGESKKTMEFTLSTIREYQEY
jgi:hypothetical protein